jgi:peptide/nickel transport system substrate-binding protein
MSTRHLALLAAVLILAAAACAPSAAPASPQGGEGAPAAAKMPQRTLVIIVREELPSLAAKPIVAFSGSLDPPKRIFNGTLDFVDEKEKPHPYLAEALPQLNTESWRVFPDGRMETVHRLRPNLRWHDGTPLGAQDFVFGWKVFATPEVGVSASKPIRQMEEVAAPDPRTVVIRWKVPFPDADRMDLSFQALPRHLLEEPFRSVAQGDSTAFANHPFWTVDYVGLGPYKVERIEPGAFLEATAFDYHALGRPKIDRVQLRPLPDPNTALANMLSGDGHFVADFILDYDGGVTLEREWAARGNPGTVFFAPVLFRMIQIQFRPEYVNPKALLDVRVRRALAHGLDVPGALDVFTGPHGVATYTLTSPRADYYPAIEQVITKRPYDLRTAQRLLEEAGYARGSDGIYGSPSGERMQLEVWTTGGAVFERENRIFVDSLRQVGVDAIPQALGPVRLRDAEFRAKVPGFFVGGGGDQRLFDYTMDAIARPENRWQGQNRTGWESPEYQRLSQAYTGTLDPGERVKQLAQMERVLNEDVGCIPLYFTVVVTANVGNLKGPVARMTPEAPLAVHYTWLWEWTS